MSALVMALAYVDRDALAKDPEVGLAQRLNAVVVRLTPEDAPALTAPLARVLSQRVVHRMQRQWQTLPESTWPWPRRLEQSGLSAGHYSLIHPTHAEAPAVLPLWTMTAPMPLSAGQAERWFHDAWVQPLRQLDWPVMHLCTQALHRSPWMGLGRSYWWTPPQPFTHHHTVRPAVHAALWACLTEGAGAGRSGLLDATPLERMGSVAPDPMPALPQRVPDGGTSPTGPAWPAVA